MVDIEIEDKDIFCRCLQGELNLFLGAGFSILAQDRDNRPLPVGSVLRDELKHHFAIKGNYELHQLVAIIMSTKKSELFSYLKRRYSVLSYSSKYIHLENLLIKNVYTTNIDNLVYKIFSGNKKYYINDTNLKGPTFNDRNAINYYPLHGSILYEEGGVLFSIN